MITATDHCFSSKLIFTFPIWDRHNLGSTRAGISHEAKSPGRTMFLFPDSDGGLVKRDQHSNVSLSLNAKLCRAQNSQRGAGLVWVRLHGSESVRLRSGSRSQNVYPWRVYTRRAEPPTCFGLFRTNVLSSTSLWFVNLCLICFTGQGISGQAELSPIHLHSTLLPRTQLENPDERKQDELVLVNYVKLISGVVPLELTTDITTQKGTCSIFGSVRHPPWNDDLIQDLTTQFEVCG